MSIPELDELFHKTFTRVMAKSRLRKPYYEIFVQVAMWLLKLLVEMWARFTATSLSELYQEVQST